MTPEEFLKLCRQKNDKGFEAIKDYIDNKGKFKTIKGPSDTSPLHLAARSGSAKVVQLLVDQGMNPMVRDKTKLGKTPIVDAIEKGFVQIALTLLNSPKLKPLKVKKRYNETSALGKNGDISIGNYKKILSAIIKAGIDVEMLDDQAHTSLSRAVRNKQIDRIKVCLDLGLDPNGKRTPLGLALHNEGEDVETVRLLLDNGAKLVIKSDDEWDGFNALHAAHYYDDPESFGVMIKEYNALETIDDKTLDEIIAHKEIEYLKHLWEIPKVHNFIIQHNLEDAFPAEVREMFVF
jgi:hypothetical protein